MGGFYGPYLSQYCPAWLYTIDFMICFSAWVIWGYCGIMDFTYKLSLLFINSYDLPSFHVTAFIYLKQENALLHVSVHL